MGVQNGVKVTTQVKVSGQKSRGGYILYSDMTPEERANCKTRLVSFEIRQVLPDGSSEVLAQTSVVSEDGTSATQGGSTGAPVQYRLSSSPFNALRPKR